MNWNNLKLGTCPECSELLEGTQKLVICTQCSFKIRRNKYDDLIKGKESSAYKNALKKFEYLRKRAKENKIKVLNSIKVNRDEKISNLRRMFDRGSISKQEYDLKMKQYE